MKVLKAHFLDDETIITTSDEFESSDYITKLDILKDLIYDLRVIYSATHKAWRFEQNCLREQGRPLMTAKARERALKALEYRKRNWTYKSIGIAMNVSSTRAQQLVQKAERLLKQEAERA